MLPEWSGFVDVFHSPALNLLLKFSQVGCSSSIPECDSEIITE